MLLGSLLLFAGGYVYGRHDAFGADGPLARLGLLPAAAAHAAFADDPDRLQLLREALREVQQGYYRPQDLDETKLIQGAAKGMIEAIGDPYSVFLTPERRALSEAELHGSFDGIGVQVDLRDGKLQVVAPLEGSPGEQAGLLPGDVITHVDGQDVSRLSLTDAVARVRGPRGTAVELTIRREGETAPRVLSIERQEIKLDSVRSRILPDPDAPLGYVRVSSFAQPTGQNLQTQLATLLQSKPQGLVLDLRSNPGGFLSSAVEVTSLFVRDGVVLFQQRGDSAENRITYRTRGPSPAADIRIAVLVDRGSASAAEVVAAALRDNSRAVLVGEKTFGKGTVQELRNLSDESQLRITVAQWLTPNGEAIHGQGLTPDIEVVTEAGQDNALAAAVAYLKDGVAARGGS